MKNRGICKRIIIESDLMRYGPSPKEGTEIAQRLTINDKGGVSFVGYAFPDGKACRHIRLNIGKDNSAEILGFLYKCLTDSGEISFATDIGVWKVTIEHYEGKTIEVEASMTGGPSLNGRRVCDLIHDYIHIEGLDPFGGYREEYEEYIADQIGSMHLHF